MKIIQYDGHNMIRVEDIKFWIMDEFFCMCGMPDTQHTTTCSIHIGLRLLAQLNSMCRYDGRDQVTKVKE